MLTVPKREGRFLAHGQYYSIANCRTEVPAMFQETFGGFSHYSIILGIFFTVYRGKSNDVLQNLVWKTLVKRLPWILPTKSLYIYISRMLSLFLRLY